MWPTLLDTRSRPAPYSKMPPGIASQPGSGERQETKEGKVKPADGFDLERIIYSFGFTGKEHIAIAEKLLSEPPKERFDRVILERENQGPRKPPHVAALLGRKWFANWICG